MQGGGGFILRLLSADPDPVAHTPGDNGRWHSLSAHSRAVGDLAAEFAEPFGGADIARLAGYLHDLGKCTAEVQQRFRELGRQPRRLRKPLGLPHKSEGAMLAAALLGRNKQFLAAHTYLAMHGHHTGIPALKDPQSQDHLRMCLTEPAKLELLVDAADRLSQSDVRLLASGCLDWQIPTDRSGKPDAGRRTLRTRMIHSALVDADFLDTSAHFGGQDVVWRARTFGMSRLRDTFMSAYQSRFADAPDTPVNALRREIFNACVETARQRRQAGIYRLPAATGTGKTMASAAFALEHAARFGKRRVIVAVPFTTITTQNAAEYRSMLGDLEGAVLEHHSNIIDETIANDEMRRLSAPQWDGEFIVTTTVQLLESLFSNRPSRTRKLHRIVDSVIVLDEVQALPLDLLAPILTMLRELVEDFGVTVLLASATQPAFWELPVWHNLPAHDILPVDHVPQVTRRVAYEVRDAAQSWESIAEEMVAERQALVVVNTRSDADQLYGHARDRATDVPSVYLLSRALTADHRQRVLSDVKDRLDHGEPVTLVSTQLIEAGVDLDFPVVFRALAPADSVIQAGGRCNRNGRLKDRLGRVVVIDPQDGRPPSSQYAALASFTRSLFVERAEEFRFDDPKALHFYYSEVYATTPQIEQKRREFRGWNRDADFPRLGSFQMIADDAAVDVVVLAHPDPGVRTRLNAVVDRLRVTPAETVDSRTRRLLERHTASVRRADSTGLTEQLSQGPLVWQGAYDVRRGALSNEGLTW